MKYVRLAAALAAWVALFIPVWAYAQGATTVTELQADYEFEARGEIEMKGKGQVKTYFLVGRKELW